MTTHNTQPFGSQPDYEAPLEEWERELLGYGMPAPVQTERVWTASSTGTEGFAGRRAHVARMAVDLDADTPTPRYSDGPVHHVTAGKRRAAKQPFSRLTDGVRHPVTVRKIG